jgi:hypothetical protein
MSSYEHEYRVSHGGPSINQIFNQRENSTGIQCPNKAGVSKESVSSAPIPIGNTHLLKTTMMFDDPSIIHTPPSDFMIHLKGRMNQYYSSQH